jgi:hypothetical protein
MALTMKISLKAEDLPKDLAQAMVNSRVTVEITFNVELVHLHGGDLPHQEINGPVTDIKVKEIRGVGGLDPVVESSRQELRGLVRTMGTNG